MVLNESDRNHNPRARQRVSLHSTQLFTPSDAFQLKAIDAGIWLATLKEKCATVDISLHPTRNIFNLIGLLFAIIKLLQRNILKAKPAKQQYRPQNRRATNSIKGRRRNGTNRPLAGVATAKNIGSIALDEITIVLFSHANKLYSNLGDHLVSHGAGLILFLRCHEGLQFRGAKLLKLKYKQIPIGDLAGSSALRLRPYGGGCLNKSKLAVLEQLINAVAIVQYCERNLKSKISACPLEHTVMVREESYLDAIYARLGKRYGARIVSMYSPISVYAFVNEDALPYHKARIVRRSDNKLTRETLAEIAHYMKNRLCDPSTALEYMKNGLNSTSALTDTKGNQISCDADSCYAAVFLHSFDDAQFTYGPDGFSDLYHWTVFTIKTLLANKSVQAIYVKRHPNVDYDQYPGDRTAIQRLLRAFHLKTRVIWLDPSCSVTSLRKAGRFIGVTHHGSIAEELVWSDIPVIASTKSPWSTKYQFAYLWANQSEYRELLSRNFMSFSVSGDHHSELLRYVYDARLSSPIKECDRWPWIAFLEMSGSDPKGNFFERYYRASRLLADLGLNSDAVKNLFTRRLKGHQADSIANLGT